MAAWAGVTRSCGRGASAEFPGEPYPGDPPYRNPLESGPPYSRFSDLFVLPTGTSASVCPPSTPHPAIPGSRASGGVEVERSGFCPECHFKGWGVWTSNEESAMGWDVCVCVCV